jgi:hypothetical protein
MGQKLQQLDGRMKYGGACPRGAARRGCAAEHGRGICLPRFEELLNECSKCYVALYFAMKARARQGSAPPHARGSLAGSVSCQHAAAGGRPPPMGRKLALLTLVLQRHNALLAGPQGSGAASCTNCFFGDCSLGVLD